MTDEVQILAALDRLEAQSRRIETQLQALLNRGGRQMSSKDRERLAVIANAVLKKGMDTGYFAVRDLLSQAGLDEQLQHDISRLFDAPKSPARAIGRFFGRVEGVTADGLRVTRGHEVRDGVFWELSRV